MKINLQWCMLSISPPAPAGPRKAGRETILIAQGFPVHHMWGSLSCWSQSASNQVIWNTPRNEHEKSEIIAWARAESWRWNTWRAVESEVQPISWLLCQVHSGRAVLEYLWLGARWKCFVHCPVFTMLNYRIAPSHYVRYKRTVTMSEIRISHRS